MPARSNSPTIDLTGVSPPILLSFKYFLETEADAVFDEARVDLSANNFANYTTAASNHPEGLADPSDGWRDFAADISQYAGQKLRIRLLFATGDNQANYFAGWFLDDIAICAAGAIPTATPSPTPSLTPSPTPIPPNVAVVYSQSIPGRLRVNQQSQIEVIMRNDGSATWSSAAGHALAVVEDPCGLFAALPFPRLYLPAGTSVPPGQIGIFTAAIKAPAQAGACSVRLQMIQEGIEFFGPTVSASPEIYVPPALDAAPDNQAGPKSLSPGQSAQFSITIRNTGSATWSAADGFALAVVSDGCNLVVDDDGLLALPAGVSVPPEGTHTFTGTISLLSSSGPPPATSAAGDCHLAFQMVQAPSTLFGGTAIRQIDVTNAAEGWSDYD